MVNNSISAHLPQHSDFEIVLGLFVILVLAEQLAKRVEHRFDGS